MPLFRQKRDDNFADSLWRQYPFNHRAFHDSLGMFVPDNLAILKEIDLDSPTELYNKEHRNIKFAGVSMYLKTFYKVIHDMSLSLFTPLVSFFNLQYFLAHYLIF